MEKSTVFTIKNNKRKLKEMLNLHAYEVKRSFKPARKVIDGSLLMVFFLSKKRKCVNCQSKLTKIV